MSEYRKLTQRLIRHLHERDLVFEFFFVFSRLEYAVLRRGFIAGGNGGVSANWDSFANRHTDDFKQDQSPDLQEAVDYFLKHPPKKQIAISGNLAWSDAIPQENSKLLLRLLVLVRRVRNNLFHGEKLGQLIEGDSYRDAHLLRHGLAILYACLSLSPEVRDEFFSETRLTLEEEEEQADGEVM